jgi:hypothetical protein
MRSLAAAVFRQGSSRGVAGLEGQANVVKGRVSKPLFSPVLSQAAILTIRTGEKPLKTGENRLEMGKSSIDQQG